MVLQSSSAMGKERLSNYPEKNNTSEVTVNWHDLRVKENGLLSTSYIISAANQHFGFFLHNEDGPVNLAWKSTMPFADIDTSISDLSEIILGKEIDVNNPESPRVEVLLGKKDGKDDVYRVNEFFDYQEYRAQLDTLSSLSSARYVVTDAYQEKAFFLHISNPGTKSENMGIALSKEDFFSNPDISSWVMDNHRSAVNFKNRGVRPASINAAISKAIE